MSGPWEKLSSQLLDAHCHVHHYEKPQEILAEIDRLGMEVFLVTVRPDEFAACLELAGERSKVHVGTGFFPLMRRECDMGLFRENLSRTRFVGEVGLDYSVEDDYERHMQRLVLQTILEESAAYGNKVLSLHSRRSAEDVLGMVGEDFPGQVIMHWYSGPLELIETAPQNVRFSVNTAMLRSVVAKR